MTMANAVWRELFLEDYLGELIWNPLRISDTLLPEEASWQAV